MSGLYKVNAHTHPHTHTYVQHSNVVHNTKDTGLLHCCNLRQYSFLSGLGNVGYCLNVTTLFSYSVKRSWFSFSSVFSLAIFHYFTFHVTLILYCFISPFLFNLWQQRQLELPFNPTPAALIALITAFTMATCPHNQSNQSSGGFCVSKTRWNCQLFQQKCCLNEITKN